MIHDHDDHVLTSALSVRYEECDKIMRIVMMIMVIIISIIILCQVSVMMKNVIDCLTGGISYWAVGHGLCVGAVRRIIFIF